MRWNSLSLMMRIVLSLGTSVVIAVVLSACGGGSKPGPDKCIPTSKNLCIVDGDKSDLVVTSVVGDRSSLTVDDALTLDATVRNRGGVGAPSTVVTFFLSDDSTISLGDTTIGAGPVKALDGGESVGVQTTYRATQVGTYYFGACVDSVVGESAVRNNCSTATRVVVMAGPAPDLVVSNFRVGDSALNVGDRLRLEATVRNSGQTTSNSTTLRYYRSSDSTISTRDTQVDSDTVSSLRAGGTDDESATVTASASGTYYYGACVDSVQGEDRTNNNCSGGVRVAVTQVQLYGGIATSVTGVSCFYTDGAVVVDYLDPGRAELAARRACESKTGRSCDATYFRSRCGAIVYGKNTFLGATTSCGTFNGVGDTSSSAVNQATRTCQQYQEDCTQVLDWGCNSR